jgi:hypothetical protein
MNAWTCAVLITLAGALGGVVNALITDNGFVLPKPKHGIWCAGSIANVIVGAFAAFGSWGLYGSGASIDLARTAEQSQISLRMPALVVAFVVGVGGARWITSEVDKRLLKKSVEVAGTKNLTPAQCKELVKGSPFQVLDRVEAA